MATIKDVAQAAQVSTAAVSRVLNKDDNISVSPEVRARIFKAAGFAYMIVDCEHGYFDYSQLAAMVSADHPPRPAQCTALVPVLSGTDDDRPVRGNLCSVDFR